MPSSDRVSMASVTDAPGAADYNLKILAPIARYFKEAGRHEELHAICSAAGILVSDFDNAIRWLSARQFEIFHEETRKRVASDEEFSKACSHRMAESYGPLKFFFWATTPLLLFRAIERASRFFTSVGQFHIVSTGPNVVRLRYESTRQESRLVCLSRQAQSAMGPTLWGMPHASVREHKCIAHGDACCEYEFRWFSRPRWLPAIVGFVLGATAAFVFGRSPLGHSAGLVALPLLGAALGQVRELLVTERANHATQTESTEALRLMVDDAGEVRRELLAMHERQREWGRLIEDEAAQRMQTIEEMSSELKRMQAERAETVRGFSHDLRSPLFVLKANISLLQNRAGSDEADIDAAIEDLDSAYERMCALLDQLMRVVTSRREFMAFSPKRIEIPPLGERLHRRIRALVHGRDIRTSVFATREAPEAIEVDPVVLDRILDNMLTNAAKYTERGSILVEVDGTPEFLVLKISDTGRGMSEDELGRAFTAGASEQRSRAAKSYGLGLSVVVDLVGRLGGRIEVMSKVGQGTTFWVYLPVASEPSSIKQKAYAELADAGSSQVVRVRRTA